MLLLACLMTIAIRYECVQEWTQTISGGWRKLLLLLLLLMVGFEEVVRRLQ